MGIRPCAGENASFAEMLRYYEDPALHLRECREAGVGVVGKIGWGVCDELILAAGMESVAVRAGGGEHELADEYLEYAFTDKGKYLFDAVAGGDRDRVPDFVVFSDSEDLANRLYYYLRELKRSEPERPVPELYLVDWLFSRHMTYQGWNERALRRFAEQLEIWSGHAVTDDALTETIGLYDRQYRAVSEILRRRTEGVPRVTGCEALVILGAKDYMDKRRYTVLVENLAKDTAAWPEAEGVRLFFSGSLQQDLAVYGEAESAGFVICGEDHDAGMRAFERPVRTDLEPLKALVDSYMLRSPSAAKGLVKERVSALLENVDRTGASCVLFYTDIYDEAASWDFPSQKKALEERGIPFVNCVKRAYPPVFDGGFRGALESLAKDGGGEERG